MKWVTSAWTVFFHQNALRHSDRLMIEEAASSKKMPENMPKMPPSVRWAGWGAAAGEELFVQNHSLMTQNQCADQCDQSAQIVSDGFSWPAQG